MIFCAGAGAAALAGFAAMHWAAPRSVADFFTLYPGHGHSQLYPPGEMFYSTARSVLLIGGGAAWLAAAALFLSRSRILFNRGRAIQKQSLISIIITALVALHVVWFAGQMIVSFTAFQLHYAEKFAGQSMIEKLRLCIGDYPDRWGAINDQTPPGARLLRHTRTDVTFLPTFVHPRLVFIYEGEEFSMTPPDGLSEAWMRDRSITHIMLSDPWEPGGPIVLKSLEEFLHERGARTGSAQRVD